MASTHNRAISPALGFELHTQQFVEWVANHNFPLHVPSFMGYAQLSKIIGHPTAGMSAIMDLLRHGAASVATWGMTMYQTGYHTGYRDILAPLDAEESQRVVSQWHDVEQHRQYLRDLMINEPRFQPGSDLIAALS